MGEEVFQVPQPIHSGANRIFSKFQSLDEGSLDVFSEKGGGEDLFKRVCWGGGSVLSNFE